MTTSARFARAGSVHDGDLGRSGPKRLDNGRCGVALTTPSRDEASLLEISLVPTKFVRVNFSCYSAESTSDLLLLAISRHRHRGAIATTQLAEKGNQATLRVVERGRHPLKARITRGKQLHTFEPK